MTIREDTLYQLIQKEYENVKDNRKLMLSSLQNVPLGQATPTQITIALSVYRSYARYVGLVHLFNQFFDNPEMKKGEERCLEELNALEMRLARHIVGQPDS